VEAGDKMEKVAVAAQRQQAHTRTRRPLGFRLHPRAFVPVHSTSQRNAFLFSFLDPATTIVPFGRTQ
jgi:hypothetical protein